MLRQQINVVFRRPNLCSVGPSTINHQLIYRRDIALGKGNACVFSVRHNPYSNMTVKLIHLEAAVLSLPAKGCQRVDKYSTVIRQIKHKND